MGFNLVDFKKNEIKPVFMCPAADGFLVYTKDFSKDGNVPTDVCFAKYHTQVIPVPIPSRVGPMEIKTQPISLWFMVFMTRELRPDSELLKNEYIISEDNKDLLNVYKKTMQGSEKKVDA